MVVMTEQHCSLVALTLALADSLWLRKMEWEMTVGSNLLYLKKQQQHNDAYFIFHFFLFLFKYGSNLKDWTALFVFLFHLNLQKCFI